MLDILINSGEIITWELDKERVPVNVLQVIGATASGKELEHIRDDMFISRGWFPKGNFATFLGDDARIIVANFSNVLDKEKEPAPFHSIK